MSPSATGESSSAGRPFPVNPMVATLEVYTTRRTPESCAAFRMVRVPSTLARYIASGSRVHRR